MKKLMFIIILIVGSISLSNRSAFSDEKTFSVICEGIGSSEDEAIKNALRLGIEQYLGVFLSGETLVKNSQLISQEILAYSRGYVEDFNIIDKQKENETYKIKVFANIKREKLLSKLSESDIININTDEVVINVQLEIERKKVAIAIMNQLMEEVFKKGYEIKVFEPKIYPIDDNNIKVEVLVNIKQNKEMFDVLMKVLEKLGKRYTFGFLGIGKTTREEGSSLFAFSKNSAYILLNKELEDILLANIHQINVNLNFYGFDNKLLASSSISVLCYPYGIFKRGRNNILEMFEEVKPYHTSSQDDYYLGILEWSDDMVNCNFVGHCLVDTLKKVKTIKATVSKCVEFKERKVGIITFLDENKGEIKNDFKKDK